MISHAVPAVDYVRGNGEVPAMRCPMGRREREVADVSNASGSEGGIHPFDRATALQAAGDGIFAGRTSDDYWNFTGPFGGATAATLLRAVIEHPKRIGTPLALTVNFCAPVAKGDFQIVVREVRTNRSTQHWSLELSQADAGVTATATAVFAARR